MMSDEQILEVVMAHKEGKKIERSWSTINGKDYWVDLDGGDLWNFCLYKYRIAPEPRKPREWMVVEKGDAICSCWSGDNHIRVREVIEEKSCEGFGVTTRWP